MYATDTIISPPQLPSRPPSHQTGTGQQDNDHPNGKIAMEEGYVEPNETLKTIDRSNRDLGDTWTDSTYSEVIDHNDVIPPETPATPYDNSYT